MCGKASLSLGFGCCGVSLELCHVATCVAQPSKLVTVVMVNVAALPDFMYVLTCPTTLEFH